MQMDGVVIGGLVGMIVAIVIAYMVIPPDAVIVGFAIGAICSMAGSLAGMVVQSILENFS